MLHEFKAFDWFNKNSLWCTKLSLNQSKTSNSPSKLIICNIFGVHLLFESLNFSLWVLTVLTQEKEKVGLKVRLSKGQEISEWKYGVVPLPKIWTKNLKNSFAHILGNATTSYFHFEIYLVTFNDRRTLLVFCSSHFSFFIFGHLWW